MYINLNKMEVKTVKKIEKIWEKDGFILRLAKEEDAEVARLTGCKPNFTHDEVVNFFKKCVNAEDRYDFMIISPDGKIIGESVINEIDDELRSANFRIGLFHSDECGKGIGSWAIEITRDFAFEELKLHRLELDVFSFNSRAIKAYKKAGFKQEGVLRDGIKDGGKYADDVLMAILEDEWIDIKYNK